MTCRVLAAGMIELHFYGDLPPGSRAGIQGHLRQCAECRRALEDLSLIRSALASRPDVAAPPGGDWSGFMAGLDGALRRAPTGISGARSAAVAALPIRRRLAPYFATAALLALVTLSVLTVARHRPAVAPGPDVSDAVRTPEAIADASRDAGLVSLSGQHFQRSKLVVLGLATRDAGGAAGDDWAYERELASTLLSDTRLYRLAVEERGMNTLAGVMRDLEMVLLQASMSSQPDPASLREIQRLIRRRDLLTKMNVVDGGGTWNTIDTRDRGWPAESGPVRHK